MERKLRFIERCSTHPTNSPQSVAEHCYYVVFYSYEIASEFEEEGYEIDYRILTEKALYHDIEESITGDIRSPSKTDRLNDEIKQIAKRELDEDTFNKWINSKDDSIEGQIVKFSDHYDFLSYCLEEMKSGNRHLNKPFQNQLDQLSKEFYHRIYRNRLEGIREKYFKLDVLQN